MFIGTPQYNRISQNLIHSMWVYKKHMGIEQLVEFVTSQLKLLTYGAHCMERLKIQRLLKRCIQDI